jgi:hypothetical protein
MNTLNTSTGCSPFRLRLGRSPRLIPPIIPDAHSAQENIPEMERAIQIIDQINSDVAEAQDNLLQAKAAQSFFANMKCSSDFDFNINDRIMLSTLHRQHEYKKKGEKWVAKFLSTIRRSLQDRRMPSGIFNLHIGNA